MKKILILCTGNSCRSQMAEGWLRHFAGDKAEIYSAGIKPEGVNPNAIKVMHEAGIDISKHTSEIVDQYHDVKFEYIITVCNNAKEKCPFFPGDAVNLHHDFPDPAKASGTEGEVLDEYRKVRDMLREYCEKFVMENLP